MSATDPMPPHTPVPDAPVEVQDDLASVRRLNHRPRILAAGGIFALILITLYGASQLGGADNSAELEEAAAPAVPATPPSVLASDAPRGVIPPAADDGRPVPPLVLPGTDETPTLIGAAPGARRGGGVSDPNANDYAELLREHELARWRYFLGRKLDAQKSADTAARTAYGAETRIAAVESAFARRDDDGGPGSTGLGFDGAPNVGARGSSTFGPSPIGAAPFGGLGPTTATPPSALNPAALQASLISQLGPGRQVDANGQASKRGFLDDAVDPPVSFARREAARSPYEIKQGTLIPGVMVTGINSDLPGQLIGQVTQNVYDSVAGAHLLIPQGTRIFGEYHSRVTAGQRRVLIAWTRLIFPDGSSLDLDRMAGSDPAGQAGLRDKVDRHLWSIYGNAVLLSAVGAGSNALLDDGGAGDSDRLARAIRQAGGDSLRETTSRVIDRGLDRQPTLVIRPGKTFTIIVERDLTLSPYRPLPPR